MSKNTNPTGEGHFLPGDNVFGGNLDPPRRVPQPAQSPPSPVQPASAETANKAVDVAWQNVPVALALRVLGHTQWPKDMTIRQFLEELEKAKSLFAAFVEDALRRAETIRDRTEMIATAQRELEADKKDYAEFLTRSQWSPFLTGVPSNKK